MKKIIFLMTALFFLVAENIYAKYTLSQKGYAILAKENPHIKTPIEKCEMLCLEYFANLGYNYDFSQNFIDGVIISVALEGEKDFEQSAFLKRMNKCHVSNGKMDRLDYKFTIAAIRDNMTYNKNTRYAVYNHMATDVLAYEKTNKGKYYEKAKDGNPAVYADVNVPSQKGKKSKGKSAKNTEQGARASVRVATEKPSEDGYITNPQIAIRISNEGRAMIKKFEGLRLAAYPDGGSYSIGYGHHSNVHRWDKISQKEAEAFFNTDIKNCEAAAQRLINGLPYKHNFSQGFVDGLVSLIYNCGSGNVSKSRFYKALKKCKVVDGKMLEKDYNYATGLVKSMNITCTAHVDRRKKECEAMRRR